MFNLRDYQAECVEAGLDELAAGTDSLLVVPTGGGKSGIAGTLKRRLFDEFDGLRILNVTHVAELVDQNYQELLGMWDWAPAGVYSAGLGRREMNARILFAGIQSIHKKAHLLGQVDVLLIDEAHLIPRDADTMYGRFITALRKANPDMRLLGLTATPYRTDSGRLDEPSERMDRATGKIVETPPIFEKVAYEVSIRKLIDDGWLTAPTTKETGTTLAVEGVHRRGGDFIQGELQAAVDTDKLNREIAEEIVGWGEVQKRRSWLIFAAGAQHAHHLHEAIARYGHRGGVIMGDTPLGERRRLIEGFKNYELRYLVNCGVLTTGFNHKGVDLLAMVRPTESTGLYVQKVGRGTRSIYEPGFNPDEADAAARLASIANGVKPNCLVLDFAGNIRRHGPVDLVQPKKPGRGGGEAPVKTCPQCQSVVHASCMECLDCGFIWERQLSEKITPRAATAPILSKTEPKWVKVTRRSFHRHEKWGAAPSVRVEYWGGFNLIAKEWESPENEKVAWRFDKWWKACGGQEPPPRTVDDALDRIGELRPIDEVRIEADGKYWRVTGRRFGGDAEDEVEKPNMGNLGGFRTYSANRDFLDDEIPF